MFAKSDVSGTWAAGRARSETSGLPLAGNMPTANVYNGNNQINGASYDAAGNQLVANGDTLSYDAENRMISATEPPALGGATEKRMSMTAAGSGCRRQGQAARRPMYMMPLEIWRRSMEWWRSLPALLAI